MKKVLLSVLLAGGLLGIMTFRFISTLNLANPAYSSVNLTPSSVFYPSIDPIEA